MISVLTDWLKQQDYRFVFLILLLIVLPTFEAPKNLFSLAYVISWLFVAFREKNFGGEWRSFDTLFLYLFLGNIVVSLCF